MVRVPLVIRDDEVPEPLDLLYPTFVRNSERPIPELNETLFASVPGSLVTLSSRVPGIATWLEVWRSPGPCTATVTDRRLVVGCRLIQPNLRPGRGPKCLGGQLRYESVSHVGIWIASGDGPSHLFLHASDHDREWRLAISTADLTAEGPELAEEVAVAVARQHLAVGQPAPEIAEQLWACAAGVRLRPGPGHAATVTLPGVRPFGASRADESTW